MRFQGTARMVKSEKSMKSVAGFGLRVAGCADASLITNCYLIFTEEFI
jgi:hypothetical protein